MSHDDVIPDSTYPPLDPPGEFKSQVPAHLLGGLSDTDKYMLDQMSIMRQYSDWSVKALLSQDKNIRLTNGKVRRAVEDIKKLQGDEQSVKIGWKVVAKIGALIVGAITLAATVYQAFHSL